MAQQLRVTLSFSQLQPFQRQVVCCALEGLCRPFVAEYRIAVLQPVEEAAAFASQSNVDTLRLQVVAVFQFARPSLKKVGWRRAT